MARWVLEFTDPPCSITWEVDIIFWHFCCPLCQDKCKHYRVENEGGSPVTAYAKVTGCTDMGTCLRLAHPEWVGGLSWGVKTNWAVAAKPLLVDDSRNPVGESLSTNQDNGIRKGFWTLLNWPEAQVVPKYLGLWQYMGRIRCKGQLFRGVPGVWLPSWWWLVELPPNGDGSESISNQSEDNWHRVHIPRPAEDFFNSLGKSPTLGAWIFTGMCYSGFL